MAKIDVDVVKSIYDVENAEKLLFKYIEKSSSIEKALAFSKEAHKHQVRKSGEAYVVHPILVAAIVASITEDNIMIKAALLHDVVEDTPISLEEIKSDYGKDVAHLVNGLTKIDTIRDSHLIPSNSNEKLIVSALSFRKMLLASVDDVRILVVKLCDRLHNMLTLDALNESKQKRIAEETLVVYAPVAHRLGISFLKNLLEDLSFHYLFPKEKSTIEAYINTNYSEIELKLNAFKQKITKLLLQNGFMGDEFEILSRVKHFYSIYLKMQRKGISIDEVLDLLAVRVLVKNPLDCYKVLGLVHLNFRPLSSRFKDYVAIPKDNGYETIHTSIFDKSAIFEVQIRTFDMHKTAELGVAAHWKYKSGESNISLDWLHNLKFQNESVEDFYELIKSDLYSEDISVFSPLGDAFTLPRGAVALDFAYAVHSEIGDYALSCLINKEKSSLLRELKNGDIVKIITTDEMQYHCSWSDAVKSSRAKSALRHNCYTRIKEIDKISGANIVAGVMNLKTSRIHEWFENSDYNEIASKIPHNLDTLKLVLQKYSSDVAGKESRILSFLSRNRANLKCYTFGMLEIYSTFTIQDVVFDYCCHPKMGDEIVSFLQDSKAHVHHKMCKHAGELISNREKMLFIQWKKENFFHYHLIVSMLNEKGALATFLTYLAKLGIDIVSIVLGQEHSDHVQLCEIECQSVEGNIQKLRSKIEDKSKVIQLIRTDDAYRV